MRFLIGFILLLALGWSGYWWVGARAQRQALETGVVSLNDAGYRIGYESHDLRGFPNRFDNRFTDLRVVSDAWSWLADGFHAYALSYQPNHIILEFLGEHHVSLGDIGMRFSAEEALASLILRADTDDALKEAIFEAKEAVISFAEDATIQPARMQLSLREAERGYDFWLEIEDMLIPPVGEGLSNRIARIRMSGNLPGEARIGRDMLQSGLRFERIDYSSIEILWDEMSATGDGAIWDLSGEPEGGAELQLKDWQGFLPVVQNWAGLSDASLRIFEVLMEMQDGRFVMSLKDGRLSFDYTPISFSLY